MVAPFRDVPLGPREVLVTEGAEGVRYLRSPKPLGAYPDRATEWLVRWASERPDRVFLAKREASGRWRELTYRDTLAHVRAIAQGLLARKLDAQRPVVILSENDSEHALIALAAMHVGIPYAPISPAYSTLATEYSKLQGVIDTLTPGLVYAASADQYARAICATIDSSVEVVLGAGEIAGRATTSFASLATTVPTSAVDVSHRAVTPDTILKFLFTSGSTGAPKGVINTHRMFCANQQAYRQALPLYAVDPLVLVDWQPWHHVAGGSLNFGVVLANGGTLYIDEGKPTASGIAQTLRNLREIAPTVYISVPKGFDALVPVFDRDPALARTFFSRLRMLFYAGAGMSQYLWDALGRLSVQAIGAQVPVMTGLGATECAPATLANWYNREASMIGLPVPGVEVKLVPNGDKLEFRVRGPSVTPGYWRSPALTQAAFDDEGFYKMGDAVRFLDPSAPREGLLFDGRVAEDFKLATGTWVSVGALRARVVQVGAPLIQDAVITGHDRNEIGALVFPNVTHCRALAGDDRESEVGALIRQPAIRAAFQALVDTLARSATGSSQRVVRLLIQTTPPSFEQGEITDKGSLSQRTILSLRRAEVDRLYRDDSVDLIRARD